MTRTALVFGASGQIGAALLARLRAADWDVLALSRARRAGAPGVRWLQGEFARMPALPTRCEVVFSCGPLDRFAAWYADSAVPAPRIVAFGSTSVHVKQASADIGERDVARRLREAEAILFATAARRSEAAVVLRPTLVYGAGRDATLTRIAALARRVGRFALPRGATGLRQPVHVDDLAAAALAADSAEAVGRGYDLPGGESLPYREMVARVLASLSPAPPLHVLPDPVFRVARNVARAAGLARDLTDAAVARMRDDLVFDLAPAARDLGYAPRPFRPSPGTFDAPP